MDALGTGGNVGGGGGEEDGRPRRRRFLKRPRERAVFTQQKVRRASAATGLPALPAALWPPAYSSEALRRLGLLDEDGGGAAGAEAFTPPPSLTRTSPRDRDAPDSPAGGGGGSSVSSGSSSFSSASSFSALPSTALAEPAGAGNGSRSLGAAVAAAASGVGKTAATVTTKGDRLVFALSEGNLRTLQVSREWRATGGERLREWLEERERGWRREERGGLAATFDDLAVAFDPTLTHVGLTREPRRSADYPVTVERAEFDKTEDRQTLTASNDAKGTFGSLIPLGPHHIVKYTNLEKTTVASIQSPVTLNYRAQLPGVMVDEALVMLRLEHANVVRAHRAYLLFSEPERMYGCLIVMERLRIDLMQLCAHVAASPVFRENPLAVEATARTVEFDILNALRHLHERGYTHGDLKPANILLTTAATRRPAGLVAKLGDFGAVMNNPQQLITGTYRYLAPEALYPMVRVSSCDVWGLFASTWELRSQHKPMVSIKTRKEVEREARWTPEQRRAEELRRKERERDPAFILKKITAFLYAWFGGGTNPGDNLRVLLKNGDEAKLKHMTFRPEGPDWPAFFAAHETQNGARLPADYKTFFAAVMVPVAHRRPTAAQLLSAPFLQDYFAGIAEHRLRVKREEPALPKAYAVGSYKSLWFAQRDETRSRSDAFEDRRFVGTLYTPEQPDEIPALMGPLHLVYPSRVLGKPPSRVKPLRQLGPDDLVAAGDYYLSRWRVGALDEPALVLSVTFPLVLKPTHFDELHAYAQKCLLLSQTLPSFMPLDEYFVQQTGGTTLVHFVVPGAEWRNLGAFVYGTPERLGSLTAQLTALGFHHASHNISVKTMQNYLWSDGRETRLNQALMFRPHVYAQEKTYDFFLFHRKDAVSDADLDNFVARHQLDPETAPAALRAAVEGSRELTPQRLLFNLAKYSHAFHRDVLLQRLDYANKTWAQLREEVSARLAPVPLMQTRAVRLSSRHAPELRLAVTSPLV